MNPLINTNITMLIALASLFLVLLFLTILHCYAKWFLDRNTRSPPSIVVVPTVVLGARGLHNLHTLLTIDRTSEHDDESPPMTKGLDSSAISSMPQFVFGESSTSDEECVICLGLFEDGQKGKRLAFCEHAFHVECIDVWLHSNTTCPVCRASAVRLDDVRSDDVTVVDHENIDVNDEQNYDGSLEMNQSLGETSLEIVVEVPKEENNGTNDACETKSIYLSDIVN